MPATLRLAINRLKRLLELIFYYPLDTFALLGQTKNPDPGTVALVHVELLGDYVLWLPYGQLLATHLATSGRRVVLVVNAQVLPLAQRHFPNCALIGISRTDFLRSLRYRINTLKRLADQNVSTTYHDSCPRDALIGDAIVRALGAPAVGFDAEFSDRPWLDRVLQRRLYSCLIPEQVNVHLSVRHLALAQIIGAPTEKLRPAGHFTNDAVPVMQDAYVAIAPGGSKIFGRWPPKNFSELAQRIVEYRPDWRIVILGTQDEFRLGEQIASGLGHAACNMAGKTDMDTLLNWIRDAQLFIGNDSGAGHIAAACGTPSLIVVGGGHLGRCFPYDPTEARARKLPATVTHPMDCFGCDWNCRYRIESGNPVPCIAGISVDAAWAELKMLLDSRGEKALT